MKPIPKPCRKCGREFDPIPKNVAYCSHSCRQEADAESMKRSYEKNREKRNARTKDWRSRNPEATLRKRAKQYNMTPEAYWELLASQGGGCAVCGRATPGGARSQWHIDHDHACCAGGKSCGKCVRGLLCGRCNMALGGFEDDPAVMQRAIEYVTRGR